MPKRSFTLSFHLPAIWTVCSGLFQSYHPHIKGYSHPECSGGVWVKNLVDPYSVGFVAVRIPNKNDPTHRTFPRVKSNPILVTIGLKRPFGHFFATTSRGISCKVRCLGSFKYVIGNGPTETHSQIGYNRILRKHPIFRPF